MTYNVFSGTLNPTQSMAAVITFFSGVPILECCRVDDKLSAIVQAE